eukprot:TRINITY_DN10531_c0_g1_i1.p4 TRINITY_DN10531_c0_g1~~TRINITY_DN10531_c0_g1_i1.p4  ORF type:complete len:125 (+),score=44.35 TRINITY_DN10531_c0_g1_i1:2007-2381(+)
MFATEWILTLFTSVVPIEQTGAIFTKFFCESWLFLYKFVIHLLKTHEEAILQKDDITEMMATLKNLKAEENSGLASFPLFRKIFNIISWKDLIHESSQQKLNEKRLKSLMGSYDLETMQFKCLK